MSEKLTVAVIGRGGFAQHFVPLFKLHPYVEKVYCCDIVKERAEKYSEKFEVEIIESFEDVIARNDINTVAIFTQRHIHGDLASRALRAGKNVYSAVPMAISVEDCKKIIDAVKDTGNVYMMGETCVYYPSSMYCREENKKGTFGKFVYAESQYFHDLSHFPAQYVDDRYNSAGSPPFFYPTHSTAMVLHAAETRAVKVTAFGYTDTEENTPFAVGENRWDNTFSDEFALMQLENGGVARVSECRRIGYKAPSSCVSGFYGTEGSYQFSNAQHIKATLRPGGVNLEEVSDYVNPEAMTAAKNDENFKEKVANHGWQWNDVSPVQRKRWELLPDSYKENGKINGHMASHQLLIDDFCTAAYEKRLPYVNAWRAARFTIPGLIAHESAKLGGVPLDIPDFGDAPWEETPFEK